MPEFNGRVALAFAHLGWRQAFSEKMTLAGRAVMHLVIVVIFWHIWQATPLMEMAALDVDPVALTWYLAITEWVIFAAGMPFREVEYDLTTGMIELNRGRPEPYALIVLSTWLGAAALRLPLLGLFMLIAIWGLTGQAPPFGPEALFLPLIACAAVALYLLAQLQIGYAAVWMGSAAPVFWVFQKLVFVLGGLILPLSLYPTPLKEVAYASPFAAMLAGPGAFVLDVTMSGVMLIMLSQLFWLCVLTLTTFWLDQAVTNRLQRQGL